MPSRPKLLIKRSTELTAPPIFSAFTLLDVTDRELAGLLGVSPRMVLFWKRRTKPIPLAHSLRACATILAGVDAVIEDEVWPVAKVHFPSGVADAIEIRLRGAKAIVDRILDDHKIHAEFVRREAMKLVRPVRAAWRRNAFDEVLDIAARGPAKSGKRPKSVRPR